MKKKYYLFAIILILILVFITSFFGVTNLKKSEQFIFQVRYEFKTTLLDFCYPEKLPKNKYKNYWIEFQNQNSNLSWFEPIKIDLTFDFITLDIKEKYVVKTTLDDLKINDLQSLKLKVDDTKELFIILKQSKPVSLIKKEVELFCESKNDQFLYEKGISKLIAF